MSIVAVHGPYTFGSKAISEFEEIIGVVSPTNGLIWDFKLDAPTTRSAQDFSWAFPTDGTPTPQAVIDPAAVTYAAAGSKTVTLTVTNTARATINNRAIASNVATLTFSAPHGFAPGQRVTITGAIGAPFLGTFTLLTAAASTVTFALVNADITAGATTGTATSASDQYPTAGTHSITITAVAGAGPTSGLMSAGEDDGDEGGSDLGVGFDPAAHNVDEVKAYADDHPDEIAGLLEAEQAGKARATLIGYLEDLVPYDPADYTVDEVVEYAEANPEQIDDLIAAERDGKGRTTLLSHLEALKDA
jgi:hypothetical protein